MIFETDENKATAKLNIDIPRKAELTRRARRQTARCSLIFGHATPSLTASPTSPPFLVPVTACLRL